MLTVKKSFYGQGLAAIMAIDAARKLSYFLCHVSLVAFIFSLVLV